MWEFLSSIKYREYDAEIERKVFGREVQLKRFPYPPDDFDEDFATLGPGKFYGRVPPYSKDAAAAWEALAQFRKEYFLTCWVESRPEGKWRLQISHTSLSVFSIESENIALVICDGILKAYDKLLPPEVKGKDHAR